MSKKKSYMNNDNIISEGLFDKIFKKLGISPDSKDKKRAKSVADKLNSIQDEIEAFNNELRSRDGKKPIKIKRYKPEDFIY